MKHFKVKEYESIVDYTKRTIVQEVIVVVVLSYLFCYGPYTLSVVAMLGLLGILIHHLVVCLQGSGRLYNKLENITRVRFTANIK